MNKTAIKNFAVWARKKFIDDITYKAGMLGITESGIATPLPQSTKDLQFFDIGTKDYAEVSGNEIKQREALVKAINQKEKSTKTYKEAFEYIIEEVAYTWFNRLIAIRFMEVNDYLPSGVRVLSSENSAKAEPDFVTNPFETDLEFTPYEQDRIIQLKDDNKLDELFRMLFIKQCNKLHDILPELFEKTDDYTELFLTISFTDKEGVVSHLIHDIAEDDFNVEKEGQVEIIGWMYQYYNIKLLEVINEKKSIPKEDVPTKTQFFTTDWIVRYMVENSLGRLWVEGHPNKELKENWKYYLDEARQEESVEKKIEEIRKEYSAISPEEIKLIDPCMGSGHILVYAFDVLMQIYDSMGYTARDAVRNIVENNIYGLDIDKRAAQLSYFAMMMKARQYDRRFLGRNIQPNIYAIRESNGIDQYAIDYFCNSDSKLIKAINSITAEMYDAKEYGSIIDVTPVDFEILYSRFKEVKDDISMSREIVLNELLPLVQVAEVLAQKYDVVITNPPYLGVKKYNAKLSAFITREYKDYKYDLFSCFIVRIERMIKTSGMVAMLTQDSWMNVDSFEKLRRHIINNNSILLATHLGFNALEGGLGTVSFIFLPINVNPYNTLFVNLSDYEYENKSEHLKQENQWYIRNISDFKNLPKTVFSYDISHTAIDLFSKYPTISDSAIPRSGLVTRNNDLFLRQWFEVALNNLDFKCDLINYSKTWYPHIKGGGYRKWYGNYDYVVNWKENGAAIRYATRNAKGGSIVSQEYYFKEGLSWSLSTFSAKFSMRLQPEGFIFNVEAPALYNVNDKYYIIGLLNSAVGEYFLNMLSDNVHYKKNDIGNIPYIYKNNTAVQGVVEIAIEISKKDWDSIETSWDFVRHPMVLSACDKKEQEQSQFVISRMEKLGSLLWQYEQYKAECENRFQTLKSNEEELNRIFIDIYGLQEELTPEVEDKNVTVYRIFDSKEEIPDSMGSSKYSLTKSDVVKDLISYAVGCMVGRYSLDVDGLAYAGGEWDNSKYDTFIPDADNCIPITDEEYFEDDIVGLFCAWLKKVYGEDTLEENLDFIANALGNKGKTSREVIRNYFLTDFIKDHIKTYQKRPIYWLFDSGKQNGFKALIYMHRWNADTIGNVRVEYLHRIQRVYEKEITRMQEIIDNSQDNKEISNATKRKEKLQKQIKETKDYDAKIAHLALSRIDIDLDDGVKVNYEKVQTTDGKKMQILAKI